MNGSSEAFELKELTAGKFPRTWAALREGVAGGVAPGMVAGFWAARDPDRIWVAAHGARRTFPRELPELPMQADTFFDLAALTQVMATVPLAAALVERRWIGWDTGLDAILPAASAPGVTIRHLLSRTAGYGAWEPMWEWLRSRFGTVPLQFAGVADRQRAMRELVLALRPQARPGERRLDSDIAFLLAGFALEEVTGLPLDLAVRRFAWGPMGLDTAHFRHVTEDAVRGRNDRYAATEESGWRGGLLQGQAHDDNCWAMGGYGGHAGVFGTIRDVLQTARSMFPDGYTIGWDAPSRDSPSAGRHFSSRAVGRLGFTGTSLWIDLEAGLAVALLTNRVHPTRENPRIKPFRPLFHDALREDLGEEFPG